MKLLKLTNVFSVDFEDCSRAVLWSEVWSLILTGTNIMLVYLTMKEEDVSLNEVDLLLKSCNESQRLLQLTYKLNKYLSPKLKTCIHKMLS